MIRAIQESDLGNIAEIHRKFYSTEFDLPDFTKHFIHAFAITNLDDKIVTVSGIRPILEVVALTDKDRSPLERKDALDSLLTISAFIADHDKFDEFHVFVQDKKWMNRLKRRGFVDTAGKSLVFKI